MATIEINEELKRVLTALWKHQDFCNDYIRKNVVSSNYVPSTVTQLIHSVRTYSETGKKCGYMPRGGYDYIQHLKDTYYAKLTPPADQKYKRCNRNPKEPVKVSVDESVINYASTSSVPDKISNTSINRVKEQNIKYGFERDNFIRIFNNEEQRLGYLQCLQDTGKQEEYKLCKVILQYQ